MLSILPIPALRDNYIWAIVDKDNAIIIDPGETIPVEAFLHQHHLTLKAILLTHHHWDHVNGALELSRQYHVPIFGPADDNISFLTHPVREGDQVHIADFPLTLNVLDIPGHTLGHIAYVGDGMLFCGDTLFSAGCGKLFEGTAAQMYHSLKKLASLPGDTKVYCGHEYTYNNLKFAHMIEPGNQLINNHIAKVKILMENHKCTLPSTIKTELAINLFLRCKSSEEFVALRKQKDTF